jgi:uncharacterized membrane protein
MTTAKNFFTADEQNMLKNAIEEAEMNTSGEIRVHLENFCWGNEITAAQRIFKRLGMHKTEERNGVLIYIATVSHKIAIIGDEGIHTKLGTPFWDKIVEKLIQQFKAQKKAVALCNCIVECGEQLKTYFPRQHNDRNELRNDISFRS